MTEAKWLACEDPYKMINYLLCRGSARKMRLLACAFCRREQRVLAIPGAEELIALAESYADGEPAGEGLLAGLDRLSSSLTEDVDGSGAAWPLHRVLAWKDASYAAMASLPCSYSQRKDGDHLAAVRECARLVRCAFGRPFPRLPPQKPQRLRGAAVGITNAAMRMLSVFGGHPTRPRDMQPEPKEFEPLPAPTFSPSWRTDTAVALARQMYDSRDFGAMPILADALQDAGCDSEDILSHCRDADAPHTRGCWVVDLVLGKQ